MCVLLACVYSRQRSTSCEDRTLRYYYYYYFSAANAGGVLKRRTVESAPKRQDTVWPMQLAVNIGGTTGR